ncbi:DUF5677 domain-containing protein, partial [Brevundimonas sp.]|uniref:DUF5677 domain-containing protein n=1 Tax=Brevundimonas sp. TaxID=1871086 RepID=UPI002FC87C4C
MTDDIEDILDMLPPDVVQEIANNAVDRGFLEEGFLSQMSTVLINHLVPNNAEWFALCDRLNRLAQKIVNNAIISGKRDDPKPISARLMLKSNQALQGAVLLSQRGMTAEAETLARTCLEITFWLGYLAKKPGEAAALFMADEHKSNSERAKMLAKLMEPEAAAPFLKIAAEADAAYAIGPKKIQIKEVAERANLADQYAYYRTLCAVSAHPSISSLDKFIKVNEDGLLGFSVGPDDDGIPFALMNTVNAHLWGLGFFAIVNEMDDTEEHLNGIR